MLTNPLREPHHRQALARALRVPDDAALAVGNALLNSLHAEELVVAGGLLHPGVEDDEVVNEFEEPLL